MARLLVAFIVLRIVVGSDPSSQSAGSQAISRLASELHWQEGSLQLSVQSNPESGNVDLHASLMAQTSILAVTLKHHLKARIVVVKDILPLADSVDFSVQFKAKVAASQAVSETELAHKLSLALLAVGAKFTVESTEIRWQSSDAAAGSKAILGLASELRWQEGSLQLSVRSSPASGNVDLHASLRARASILANTLKHHLKARTVVVKDILPLGLRRLGGRRRLEAGGNSVDFLVQFEAKVAAIQAVSETALASKLSLALLAVGAEFTVESTEIHWQSLDATANDQTSTEADANIENFPLPLMLAGIAGILVVALAGTLWLAIRSRIVAQAEPNAYQKEMEEQIGKRQDDGKAADTNKGELDDTASTATPASDYTRDDIEADVEVMSVVPMDIGLMACDIHIAVENGPSRP